MWRKAYGVFILAAGLTLPAARGGLYDNIYRGLELFVTPSGSPIQTTGDGGMVNGLRSGRIRILPNDPGHGYFIEIDRNFGVDSRGRPEVLDFGTVELELNGNVASTLGYTSRGYLIGNGDLNVSNLNYSLRGKTGAQDAELKGILNVDSALELTQTGFYDLKLNISNTNSQFLLDGVLVKTDIPTNFDIGPISVKGNIFVDAAVGLLESLGVDTSGFGKLFPSSGLGQLDALIQQQLGKTGTTAQASAADLPMSLLQTALNPDAQSAQNALDAALVWTQTGGAPDAVAGGGTQLVPEPGTLLLIAGGALLVLRRRFH